MMEAQAARLQLYYNESALYHYIQKFHLTPTKISWQGRIHTINITWHQPSLKKQEPTSESAWWPQPFCLEERAMEKKEERKGGNSLNYHSGGYFPQGQLLHFAQTTS
jgi:hypothetical protein